MGRKGEGRKGEGHTGKFIFDVLIVLVVIAVLGDECSGFSVAHVLHLVAILFKTDLAEVARQRQ